MKHGVYLTGAWPVHSIPPAAFAPPRLCPREAFNVSFLSVYMIESGLAFGGQPSELHQRLTV